MTITGYARTSTLDQIAGLEDQIAALIKAGCDPQRIWHEQVSSVDKARPQLTAALEWLRDGDTFVVTRPDRLARSSRDMFNILHDLEQRGVTIRILSMNLDTSTATGKLMLAVLAGVAEFERDIMLERQRAGIAKAKADGKYRKRKSRLDRNEALILRVGGASFRDIGNLMGCDAATIHRLVNKS